MLKISKRYITYYPDDFVYSYTKSSVVALKNHLKVYFIPVAVINTKVNVFEDYLIIGSGKSFTLKKLNLINSDWKLKNYQLAFFDKDEITNIESVKKIVDEFDDHMINFVCDSSKNPHAGATLYTSELRHKQDPENNDLIIKKNELL